MQYRITLAWKFKHLKKSKFLQLFRSLFSQLRPWKEHTNKYSTMYDHLEKNCIDKQPSKTFRVQVSSLNQILWFRPYSVDQSDVYQLYSRDLTMWRKGPRNECKLIFLRSRTQCLKITQKASFRRENSNIRKQKLFANIVKK